LHPLNFFTFIIFSIITFIGIYFPYPATTLPILFIFIVIPLIDALIGKNKTNPNAIQENRWKLYSVWAPALYLYALTHFLLLGHATIQSTALHWGELPLLSLVIGLYTGGLGITVAHELCHKKDRLPRIVSELLLSSVCYQHFAIEHVRGHHHHVSTDADPASARFNESFYSFFPRTLKGTFINAINIDIHSVQRGIALSCLWMGIAFYFGIKAGVFFILQSAIAITLLELVNYVEHYGLRRKKLENGRYEKVQPQHSWNSAHHFSNSLLFNLQRHSDHHAAAHLPYTVLKHQDSAPQLPSGYPGMIILALLPSLWFRVMNPRLNNEQEKLQ
jgi:alkane 1-monooxygenase